MDSKNAKEKELRNNSDKLKLRYVDSVSETESIFACKICDEIYTLENSVVNNQEFKCDICIEREKLDILERHGITLEYKSKDKRVYKYNECNHYITISGDKLIDYNSKCQECKLKNLENQAETLGLELLIEIDDEYGWYKFNKCEHLQKISFTDINDDIICETCEIDNRRLEARKVGLQYVEPINKEYDLYRCVKCNDLKKLSFSEINQFINEDSNVLCKNCLDLGN